MSPLRLLKPAIVFAGILAVAPAADTIKDVVVIDFTHMPRDSGGDYTKAYDYVWNEWNNEKKFVQIPERGLLINHLSGKGNFGEKRGLDFRKHAKARIDLILGNGNQAKTLGFQLTDKDGTEVAWDLPLADIPKGVPVSVVLDLTKPTNTKSPGKVPGVDLKKLREWQFLGNYQDDPVEVMLLKVTAVTQ